MAGSDAECWHRASPCHGVRTPIGMPCGSGGGTEWMRLELAAPLILAELENRVPPEVLRLKSVP